MKEKMALKTPRIAPYRSMNEFVLTVEFMVSFLLGKARYHIIINIEIFGRCKADEKKIVQKKKLFYFCTLEKNIVLR